MNEHTIRLPFPPSSNNLFVDLSPEARAKIAAGMKAKGKRGRPPTRVLSTAYKKWRYLAVALLGREKLRFTEPVVVELTFTPPDHRRRDPDNFNKAPLDALVVAGVIPDDCSRWVRIVPWWDPPSSDAHVLVTIRPWKDPPATLTAAERKALERLRSENGIRIGRLTNSLRSLADKGRVEVIPGLLDETPQGCRLTPDASRHDAG